MNARRLFHLKNAGASAALEIARQDGRTTYSQIYRSTFLCQFSTWLSVSVLAILLAQITLLSVDMQVCASCGTRTPDDPYSRKVVRRLAHVPQPGFSPLFLELI